jgi:hypothetical protein
MTTFDQRFFFALLALFFIFLLSPAEELRFLKLG